MTDSKPVFYVGESVILTKWDTSATVVRVMQDYVTKEFVYGVDREGVMFFVGQDDIKSDVVFTHFDSDELLH